MEYCLISPYSQKMRNGKNNPKNFPYWTDVVAYIHNKGLSVVQIGSNGEERIKGVGDCKEDSFFVNKNFEFLEEASKGAYKWLSVDNFFHHFCASINVPGIVIFGRSDPKIFGHSINTNLLKDRKYLRSDQFGIWESVEYTDEVFISADQVCKYII